MFRTIKQNAIIKHKAKHKSIRFFSSNARHFKSEQILKTEYNLLHSTRLSSPNEELERLKSDNLIHTRLNKITTCHFSDFEQPSLFQQIAFGRSLEIFQLFNQSHYVLHHGQSGKGLLALNMLITSLLHRNEHNPLLEFQTVLRHPVSLKNIDQKHHSVEWYKHQLSRNNATDTWYTDSLIAADAYLASNHPGESAWDYFTHAYNKKLTQKALADIINDSIADQKLRDQFLLEFNALHSRTLSENENGVLYAICIPKDYFNQCAFLARTLGIPALEVNEEVMLQKMQMESYPYKYDFQVRLLAHKLDPAKVKIFIFPSTSDEVYFQLLKDLQALMHEYQLLNYPRRLSHV